MTEELSDPSALRSFKDIPPPTFNDEKGGPYMLGTLSQRELWKKRPREEGEPDPILFLNLQSDRKYSFDAGTFITREATDLLNNGDGYNGVVIVASPMYGDNAEIKAKLIEALPSLKPGASVFLFEKWGTNADKQWRENVLREVGLVDRNVLASGRKVHGSTLWEAHMPREGGLSNPINLLENGPFWIKEILKEMRASYEKEGYAVVDDTELMDKLKKSKFPLKDIYLIRDRAGVTIQSTACPTQTCAYKIDTSGNKYTINECGEKHVKPGVATVEKTPEHKPGETIVYEDRPCNHCGESLQGLYFQWENKPMQIEVSCPHDGFVEIINA